MIGVPFDKIDKAALEELVGSKMPEGKTLEYKRELPRGTNASIKEFLADVSSFANASWGDMVYGIDEERDEKGKKIGVPKAAVGLQGVTGDEARHLLEGIIRDGLGPPLRVHIKSVEGFPNGPVVVLRIPRSWSGPHMVMRGASRFFSRAGARKYPLDVEEIRTAFALSETLPEKIRSFRAQRLSMVVAEETPVPLPPNAKTVLHLLPLSALRPAASVVVEFGDGLADRLQPIAQTDWEHRINLDGFLTYGGPSGGGRIFSYTQLFRTGTIEAVDAWLLGAERQERKIIPHPHFESPIVEGLAWYLAFQKELGIQPPVVVMLSLLGVKGYKMYVTESTSFRGESVDRDALLLPEALVDDFAASPEQILKPAFDALWQACGYGRSLNYDEKGQWIGPKERED